MMKHLGRFGVAILVLVILQTLFLGWMIAGRAMLLHSGDVITLKSEPVDPRDIFRGDYVTLTYAISRLSLDGLPGDKNFKQGDKVYVEVAPAGDTWIAAGAWSNAHEPASGNRIIRGTVGYVTKGAPRVRPIGNGNDMEETPCPSCIAMNVTYGIEAYFVPEGEGKTLEKERNARNLSVDVALAKDGEAAIKALRLDGALVYSEPLL